MTKSIKIKKGPQLWKKAKTIIPGGTQLLSKRSEMFLPDQWPSYYKKAKGIKIWDLDGNEFVDMSYMGIGACVLGYADSDVNRAVKKVVDNGSMTTLNSFEEVELAELLIKLHPWAKQVRYARTGGEAMAIAVRIARAYTKKDKIAFCGYHGWMDWYLAANLADKKNLDGQLLPGLEPLGVPRCLRGTALPFNYNRLDEFKNILKDNKDIGVVVMEPRREHEPEKGFLEEIRKITEQKGIVLIFDEITSGFRMNVGGIHMINRVYPDIAVFAKAMSNGYPMAAIIGKENVMEIAQKTFISSTYWTERVGPAAAIATIKKLKALNVPSHLCRVGKMIGDGWQALAKKHNLNVKVMNILPLITFKFDYQDDSQAIHTLFNQEMLKRGYLVTKSVYVSYAHKEKDVVAYLAVADKVFKLIKEAIDKKAVHKMLKGPIAHQGFRRLT